MPPEVLVTGVGIVSPAGLGAGETWRFLQVGGRAVGRVSLSDPHSPSSTSLPGTHPSPEVGASTSANSAPTAPVAVIAPPNRPRPHRAPTPEVVLAASVHGFTPPAGMEARDRVCQFAVAAADEAARDAGLLRPDGSLNSMTADSRVAVSIGTSKGGILSFASLYPWFPQMVLNTENLLSVLSDIPPDAPARHVAARYGVTGPVHASVAACSTGTLAVIRGAQMILDGTADVVFAGSSDASIHQLWLAAFENMGVLATEHPDLGPDWACRPFDRGRDGFAVGEGAGVLILESAVSAARRGVAPLARLRGWAMGTDPAGLNQLSQDATPLAHMIRLAISRAGVAPSRIAAILAHGTGTISNDLIEASAIRQALVGHADTPPITSLKGAIGHLLGAAGAVELAVAVLAVQDGVWPGNNTLVDPDLALGCLNLPRRAVSVEPGPILKTSLGFGGHVAAVILERA